MANDELDGVLAFDNVLDRLIDAESRARSASFEVSDMRSKLTIAENDLSRMRKERDDLKAEDNRNTPKLFALWQAADHMVRAHQNKRSGDVMTETATALRDALTKSFDACDQIPF